MSGLDKLQLDASRASRAADLIDNEMLQEAFQGLEEAYTQAWRATTIDAVQDREKLFLAINIVGKVREHLISIISNGKLAAAELRAIAQTAEPPRRWENVQ